MVLAVGGVFAREASHRQFYLAAATVPIFTLIRLTLIGTLPSLSAEIISYLLLAATLIFFQYASQFQLPTSALRGANLVRSLRGAIPLGFAVAFVGIFFLPVPPAYEPLEAVFAVLAAGAVAFIDEYWFRGILQPQISAASSRPILGWFATVFLFVAFAAPTGDLAVLIYRAGLGTILGFFVWWRGLLPLALMTRTASVIFFGVLSPLDLAQLLPG